MTKAPNTVRHPRLQVGVSDNPDQQALFLAALVVLLEEKGGAVTFTDAEYRAINLKFGGSKGYVMRAEVTKPPVGEPQVTVRLVNRQPGSARPT